MPWPAPAHSDYPWHNAPNATTPLDQTHLKAFEDGIVAYIQQIAALLGVAATSVKATNYTAAAGDFVPVDTSGGPVTITLPSPVADQARVGVKLVSVSGTNAVTIATAGTDRLNTPSGPASTTLAAANQVWLAQYQAATGVWYAQAEGDVTALVPWKGPWSSLTAYALGDGVSRVVADGSTHLFISQAALNLNHDPTANDGHWIDQLPSSAVTINSAPYVRPEDHGAVGNGTTDDTAALVAADAVAAAAHLRVLIEHPYLISSTLTNAAPWVGTTTGKIIKKSGMSTDAIRPNADLIGSWTVDCNRSGALDGGGGATGNGVIVLAGQTVVMRDVIVKSSNGVGIGSAGTLTCYAVESYDHVASAGADGAGFDALSGGLLRTYGCNGHDNSRYGFRFRPNCAAGGWLDGRSSQNNIAGASIEGPGQTVSAGTPGTSVGIFRSVQDNGYGVVIGDPAQVTPVADATGDTIVCYDTGLGYTRFDGTVVASNNSGTSVEFFGATDCGVGTIIAQRPLGYGVAFNKATASSTHNQIGTVLVDATGASDTDPAVFFGAGAQFNRIGTLTAVNTAVAVSCGEGTSPTTNDNNTIEAVFASATRNGIIKSDGGSYNHFGRVIGHDCRADGTSWPALLYFNTANAVNNTIGYFEHRSLSTTPPFAILTEAAGATGNKIRTGDTVIPDPWAYAGELETMPRWRAPAAQAMSTGLTGGVTLSKYLLLSAGVVAPQRKPLSQVQFVATTGMAFGSNNDANLWFCVVRQSDLKVIAFSDDYGQMAGATWATGTAKVLGTTSMLADALWKPMGIHGTATGGTATLTLNAQTTATFVPGDTAATVQSRIQALGSVGAGNCLAIGGPFCTAPIYLTFLPGILTDSLAIATASLTGGTLGNRGIVIGQAPDPMNLYLGLMAYPGTGGAPAIPAILGLTYSTSLAAIVTATSAVPMAATAGAGALTNPASLGALGTAVTFGTQPLIQAYGTLF